MNYNTRWSHQQKDELPDIWDVTGAKGPMLYMPLLQQFPCTPEMREPIAWHLSLNLSMDIYSLLGYWCGLVILEFIHPLVHFFFVWRVAKGIIRRHKWNPKEFKSESTAKHCRSLKNEARWKSTFSWCMQEKFNTIGGINQVSGLK